MSTAPDVVIIGAGLSGLVDAILLAETGRRVRVLEQHTIPGGYLQQFLRKRTRFDVGFHYMGSTRPGRPMRQMLEHLQVYERLRLLPFPADAAIEVVDGARRFAYPTTFAAFRDKGRREWPAEADAFEAFLDDVDRVCGQFKWFAMKKGREYQHPLDMDLSRDSFQDYLEPRLQDPWLRQVLNFQTFNLGLFADEIPWVKHVLAFRSNFDETCRIDGGGGALVDALVARGRELGVEHRFGQAVQGVECDGRRVRAVTTAKGERHEADLFVSSGHPKPILRAIPDADLNPLFKQRVLDMRDSRGGLQVFLRLKEPVRSLGASCVMVRDAAEESGDPPLSTVLVTNPCAVETVDRGGPRLEAMTYLEHEPFARWSGTRTMRRGPEYEQFKDGLVRRMVGMIARVVPELPDLIEDAYSSTPLTDEWYTLSERGAVFGISHDVTQQGTNRPMLRNRLKNLFFTGHSIAMPGICGTFINAFDSCDAIRGDGVLFDQVAT